MTTLEELTLAWPKAKVDLYYSSNPPLFAIANYEENLLDNLEGLRQRINGEDQVWLTDKVDIFDQSEIHDHLPQAVDSIEPFLNKHAFKSAEFTAMRRTDVWSIPLTMLREAIINALVHSDYSQRGSPIRIAFFDDRIEIESPGMLLPGMTVEDMKNGVSMIRNPVIARVFRELKLIERWGRGVKRIFAEAAAQGLPEPQIQEIANRVRLIIALAAPVNVAPSQADSLTRSQQESRLESRLESELAARVVMLLRQQPLGKAALAQRLGHQTVSGELHKQIKRLLELAVIEMTLPDKPNSRLQKYRLLDASLTKDDA